MIRCDLIGLSRGAAQLVLHFSVSINIQVDKNRSDNATLGSLYHANLPILQMAKSKFSLQRVCVCVLCVCVLVDHISNCLLLMKYTTVQKFGFRFSWKEIYIFIYSARTH